MSTERSLLSIINEASSIEGMIIESGGELTPDIEMLLEVNQRTLAEKVDAYHMVIERFEALEKHYQSRSDYFKTISGQCKSVILRLKNNIKFAMQEMGVEEIKGLDMRFKLSQTPGSLVIEDPEMVPVEFKKEVISTEIDKKALKEALGKHEVPGAKLDRGFSLRTYANIPDKKTKAVTNV